MLDESIMRRLAFIRYLYNVAVEQSQRPEPMCSSSILTFHDCIELFLQLGSEYHDVSRKVEGLMDYWQILKEEKQIELGQKASMRRLNKARVNLKHHGTLPSRLSIDDFRVSVMNFFDENTSLIFGIDFSEISLIELVHAENAKNNLKDAEKLLKEGKYEDSLDKVALAFSQIIDDYEDRKRDKFGRSPFFFGESLWTVRNAVIGNRFVQIIPDEIINSIESLQNSVKILSLGIDYRKYAKFRLLTPRVMRFAGGKYEVQRFKKKSLATKEEVQFCINFVIESAVILQEFDFDIVRAS